MGSALRHGAACVSRSLQGRAALLPRVAIPSTPWPLPVHSRGPCGGWKQAPALRRGESGLRRQPPEPFSSPRPLFLVSVRVGVDAHFGEEGAGPCVPCAPPPRAGSVLTDLPRPPVGPLIPATLRPIWRPSTTLPQNVSSSPTKACGFPAGTEKPQPPNRALGEGSRDAG